MISFFIIVIIQMMESVVVVEWNSHHWAIPRKLMDLLHKHLLTKTRRSTNLRMNSGFQSCTQAKVRVP